jgi:hypothetical protein
VSKDDHHTSLIPVDMCSGEFNVDTGTQLFIYSLGRESEERRERGERREKEGGEREGRGRGERGEEREERERREDREGGVGFALPTFP